MNTIIHHETEADIALQAALDRRNAANVQRALRYGVRRTVEPWFRYPPELPLPKSPDRPLLIGLGLIVLFAIAVAVLCVIKALHL